MYCKPGKARPMVQKVLAMSKLGRKLGLGSMRVMTDVSGERYWTVVSEVEIESLEAWAEMANKSMDQFAGAVDRRRLAHGSEASVRDYPAWPR